MRYCHTLGGKRRSFFKTYQHKQEAWTSHGKRRSPSRKYPVSVLLPTRMGTNGVGSIPAVSTKRVVQNCRRPSTRCSAGKSQLLGGLFPLSYCFRFRLRSSIQRLLERSTPKITERSMLTPRSWETGMPSRTCASSTSQTYG